MPPIEKSERREVKRQKLRDSKYQNIRYRTLRAGESLAAFEAERKTTLEGKPIKPRKRRK